MSAAVRFCVFALVVGVGLLGRPIAAQSPSADAAAVTAVVSGFHTALKAGNAAEVMRLLAADALLLEAGGIETRAEYEKNHLPADIEFEKAIASTRTPSRVTVAGEAAWAVTTSEFKGTFQNRPVDSIGVELMVLSRDPAAGWRIRSIHWSGRARQPAK
jgi:ketosteroid isomerase-like protein